MTKLVPAPDDALPPAILALCEAIAAGTGWPATGLSDAIDVDRLQERLEWHRLIPRPPSSDAAPLPPWLSVEIRAGWRREYHARAARNLLALQQLEAIVQAFAESRLPLIALKGAAALLWIYDDLGRRAMADLDLLIEARAIPAARRAIEGLGYTALPFHSSELEEELLLKHSHLNPYVRDDRLQVELHVHILQGRGHSDRATPELWRDAVEVTCGAARLRVLSPVRFLLHGCTHFMNDLETAVASLDRLVDLIAAVRKWGAEIDWPEFWHTAHRWEVPDDAATVMATLNRHWGLGIPGIPAGAAPLSAAVLVYGSPNAAQVAAARQVSDYLARVAAARALPDLRSRARYLLGLLFPSPEKLRHQHSLHTEPQIALHYLRRPFQLGGRLLRGLLSIARRALARRRDERD